jgi:hypothetical protein
MTIYFVKTISKLHLNAQGNKKEERQSAIPLLYLKSYFYPYSTMIIFLVAVKSPLVNV